jgi:hypothetical protein
VLPMVSQALRLIPFEFQRCHDYSVGIM